MYEQWKALVELQWPIGRKAVLDIAHDHVGTSQFHPLHGQVRHARFNHSGKAADLYKRPSPYLGSYEYRDAGQGGLDVPRTRLQGSW